MLKRFTLTMIMLACLAAPAFSQNSLFPTVVISNKTIEVDGKFFYVHHVEPKQTFFSICRAYDVSIEDIKNANPKGALNKGLKAGMDLLVPCKNDPVEEKIETVQIVSAVDGATPQTIQGQVKPKKFNLPFDVEFFEYRVKWYDNIYLIAEKNHICVEAIELLNDLETRVVTSGQKLLLPEEEFAKYFNLPDALPLIVEEETAVEIETETPREEPQEPIPAIEPFTGTAKIALVLPFEAEAETPDYNYYDFYSGFLMAVNNSKKAGMNIDLTVLDEYDYGLNDTFDFIVGPVFREDIEDILEFCNTYSIPMISPLDPSAEELTESNPFLIQMPASSATQVKNLITSIEYDETEDNVIVLHETGTEDSFFQNIKDQLDVQKVPYKVFDYTILGGREITEPLRESYLESDKMNHFIIASEKESFASDAVRNISVLTLDTISYNVTGYASQRLRNFDAIEVEDYQTVGMHFSTGYYVDYSSAEVKSFVKKFRALFGAEPNTYAFQGYDLATYFLGMLQNYGKEFVSYLEDNPQRMLQTSISLRRKENGGHTNEATTNIIYRPEYRIEVK